jgi:hypothetical protein
VTNITLSNTGTATLNIASIAPTGANAGDFARVAPTAGTNCAATLAAGTSCTVGAQFTPTAAGTRSAFMTFTDNSGNAAGSTQNVQLTGTGVAVAPVASLQGNMAFGSQQVGVATTRTATLANTGSAPMTVNNIAVTGTGFSRPAGTAGGTCPAAFPATLAAGAPPCTIVVRFQPATAAATTGAITVTDNAAGSPHTLALSGSGVAAVIQVTPNPLAFGNTNRPTCVLGICLGGGKTMNLTVRNSGAAGSQLTVTLPNPPITGTNANLFSISSNGCGAALASGAQCTISVRFLPTTTGAKTATLQINSNAATSPTLVSLTGTGV